MEVEEENSVEWEPIRAIKARLEDLDQRRRHYATDMLHKVKLIWYVSKLPPMCGC
jgi:hypothetical protein